LNEELCRDTILSPGEAPAGSALCLLRFDPSDSSRHPTPHHGGSNVGGDLIRARPHCDDFSGMVPTNRYDKFSLEDLVYWAFAHGYGEAKPTQF